VAGPLGPWRVRRGGTGASGSWGTVTGLVGGAGGAGDGGGLPPGAAGRRGERRGERRGRSLECLGRPFLRVSPPPLRPPVQMAAGCHAVTAPMGDSDDSDVTRMLIGSDVANTRPGGLPPPSTPSSPRRRLARAAHACGVRASIPDRVRGGPGAGSRGGAGGGWVGVGAGGAVSLRLSPPRAQSPPPPPPPPKGRGAGPARVLRLHSVVSRPEH
jgi:hypothetical protein